MEQRGMLNRTSTELARQFLSCFGREYKFGATKALPFATRNLRDSRKHDSGKEFKKEIGQSSQNVVANAIRIMRMTN